MGQKNRSPTHNTTQKQAQTKKPTQTKPQTWDETPQTHPHEEEKQSPYLLLNKARSEVCKATNRSKNKLHYSSRLAVNSHKRTAHQKL
jgi:16S rRNA U516 pseudouridylate synthase RsuA-like enzyme